MTSESYAFPEIARAGFTLEEAVAGLKRIGEIMLTMPPEHSIISAQILHERADRMWNPFKRRAFRKLAEREAQIAREKLARRDEPRP